MAKDIALKKIAPILADAESVKKSQDMQRKLKAKIAKLRDGNFELCGSHGASSTKISQLQEAKKKADEKAKAVLADYTALEREYEDYKAETHSNLEQYKVQPEAMDSECHRLCVAADPVLDMIYPATACSNSECMEQITSLLKTAPERIKGLVKEHTTIGCSQALSIAKSLYPQVEVAAISEGYAAGTTEEKTLQLINEVHDVAAIIADDVVDL